MEERLLSTRLLLVAMKSKQAAEIARHTRALHKQVRVLDALLAANCFRYLQAEFYEGVGARRPLRGALTPISRLSCASDRNK